MLVRHAALAERYVFDDPNSALIKLRTIERHMAAGQRELLVAMAKGLQYPHGQLQRFNTRDELSMEIADFNRKVSPRILIARCARRWPNLSIWLFHGR